MKLRENFKMMLFIISMWLWILTIAITPVGGWCNTNPDRVMYMTAFAVTSVISLVSTLLLMFDFNSNK